MTTARTVLADLARWVFHSPARMVAAVVLSAVAAGSLALVGHRDQTPTVTVAGPTTTSPNLRPAPPPVSAGRGDGPAADPAARAVAVRFVSSWLAVDRPPRAWHSAVARDAAPALAEGLAATDPARVPVATLLGLEAVEPGEHAQSFRAWLSNQLSLQLLVVDMGRTWKVADLEPEG